MLPSSCRRALVVGALYTLALPGVPATAAPLAQQWVVTGPTGSLSATVTLDDADGILRLGATRAGRTVLAAAPVGLRTTDADLTRGLRMVGSTRRTVTDQYSMITGKRRNRATQMSELALTFQENGGRRFDLVVRVTPDAALQRLVRTESGADDCRGRGGR